VDKESFIQSRASRFVAAAVLTGAAFLAFRTPGGLYAQGVIENPAKPRAANAGRVVTPKEVLVISDESASDYYFKWPRGLATGPAGSLFVIDQDQLMQFGPDGRFLRNLFKKGQGPGEMAFVGGCVFSDENIIVQASSPYKLLWFDNQGVYEKEIPIRSDAGSIMNALFFRAGHVYLHAWSFPRGGAGSGIVDIPHHIFDMPESGGELRTLASFPTKSYTITSESGGGGMFSITSFRSAAFRGKDLVISHTAEYLLKIYDPAADKILKEFRRAYERVKAEPLTEEQKKGGLIIDGKHYGPPENKYESDIPGVLTRGGEIWAVTSTRDKAKGALIDVFDGGGVYQDAFYLNLGEAALQSIGNPGSCCLDGDLLWVIERNEDETVVIKKYRVEK